MGPEIIVPVSGMLMIVCIVLGIPLVRSYTRRVDSKPRESLPSGELITRLDRIEQAVEAMATEVERIAEGQRFTTKLLSDARPASPQSIAAPKPTMRADGTVLTDAARST